MTTPLLRSINLGITNFWRNKALSTATIIVIATIIFIFNVILIVHSIANQSLKIISERVDIVVYLHDDVSFYDAQNLIQNLKSEARVSAAKYTSKEEALDIVAKTHPKTAEFLRKFNLKNPLPPSISITTTQPEDYQKVIEFLENGQFKSLLKNYVTNGGLNEGTIMSGIAKNLMNISHFVRQIIFWLVFTFILGGTLVIINAIQLTIYTRRNEIEIMRLVGATPTFMRLPFIIEGIIYSMLAVFLSFFFLVLVSKSIQIETTNIWNYYRVLEITKVFLAELAITIALGAVSSFVAIHRYIK